MTAWKRRMEKSTACWAVRPLILRWQPVISRRLSIVAVVGDDFAQEDVDLLASRQIDLSGLERVPGGKTFFWAGVYSADMNDRTTLRTDLNVFADFNPKLPESYRTSRICCWATFSPRCRRCVRAQMNGVQTDRRRHHELLDQRFSRRSCWRPLKEWDFLLINDSEARLLSGEYNLRRAAARIHGDGTAHAGDQARANTAPSCSAAAATSWRRATCWRTFSTPPARAIVSPEASSATWPARGVTPSDGDIDSGELRRAVIYGSVMGSFCCEKFGVDRFRTLTREEIDARYQEFQNCTAF